MSYNPDLGPTLGSHQEAVEHVRRERFIVLVCIFQH